MTKLVGAFFPFFLFLVVSVSAKCPSDDVIYPCQCRDQREGDSYIELECIGEEVTQENLKTALNALDKADMMILMLEDVDLGSVPSDFFAGFNIGKIEIVRCDLISLTNGEGRPFTGLENTLRGIDIMSSITEDFKDSKPELSHLTVLNDMTLSNNVIKEVGNDWFQEMPPQFARLLLHNNGIEQLGDKAFANLHRLMTLELVGNRFGSIQRSMLPQSAEILEDLVLDDNALESLPNDIFSNMPALKEVSLRSNGLTKVEENTFGSVWEQLTSLDLAENPLECDSYTEWISSSNKPAHLEGKCSSGILLKDL